MNRIFLQTTVPIDPNAVINRAFDVNPNNVLGLLVGFLVLLLIVGGWFLWQIAKKNEEKDDKMLELSEKVKDTSLNEVKEVVKNTIGDLEKSNNNQFQRVFDKIQELKDTLK